MAKLSKHFSNTNKEYTLSYSSMRGVDFSLDSDGTKRYRYADCENMYKDYDAGGYGITESIPGFRKIAALGEKINGIFCHKDSHGEEYIVVHSGTKLYYFKSNNRDTLGALVPIGTVLNTRTHAYCSGYDIYILDGEKITRVAENGVCSVISNDGTAPYTPITYYNGEEYEQRNLLTDLAYEKWLVSTAREYTHGSDGLKYRITSFENKYCSICGMENNYGGSVYIPTYATIGGEKYRVTQIDDCAFSGNAEIQNVYLSYSVLRVGKYAFRNCGSLVGFYSVCGLEVIDDLAFSNCRALKTLYIGEDIIKFGESIFENCDAIKNIYYAKDSYSFTQIENYEVTDEYELECDTRYERLTVGLPLSSPATRIWSVTVDGQTAGFSFYKNKDGLINRVSIVVNSEIDINGKEVTILLSMSDSSFGKNSAGINFLSSKCVNISGADAINGCTVCECFDGRIFLSGNKSIPNIVFYSSRDKDGKNNPTYFGVLNYFNDGIGSFGVKSMLAAGESLAVFKDGDDGTGSIYYHVPKETGIDILPKVYPVSYVHNGIVALGDSISFFDDPVFISSLGLSALDKKAINLERSVSCRSHNVNPRLLSEDASSLRLAKWCGYLVILAGENIYLADSRATFTHSTGSLEYEWYYLTGIGTYTSSKRVYRYSSVAKAGYSVWHTPEQKAESVVMSLRDKDGDMIYYTLIDNIKYAVHPTEELTGGMFSKSSAICGTDENLLFFGTESGDVCIFNNDKRGVPPPYILEQEDFDYEEYKEKYSRKIHPYFYSFDFHSPRYYLRTVSDNGGYPHMTKNTTKRSLAIKVKCFGMGTFVIEAVTDKSGYKEICRFPDCELDFADFDFSALSFLNTESITLPVSEKEKNWTEKAVCICANEYCSPIGLYSITYRFAVKGRIKPS